jgi:dTMP kinase
LRGRFITFEGIDGSGKTTQLRPLEAFLRGAGRDVVTTCEPGGTSLGRRLRAAFLESDEAVSPLAELLLFAADRAQHVEHLIRPSLADGKIVLSDRYADATEAYQGGGRGFDGELIAEVIKLATGGLRPDLTLFFDIPVETAFRRMANRRAASRANRMDGETSEFYTRVRDAYLAIAEREPERFRIIDAARTIAEIKDDVQNIVREFLD